MALTNTAIQNAKPAEKPYKIYDTDGLFMQVTEYLEAKTRTDWSFPNELDDWIAKIEATDSSSTFFRYPVTKDKAKDKEKSAV